ncbi:hypothetical protein SAMN04489729_1454 [Amycolatopsis lurida]|uniref:Trypsin-co-occurring domain-containing protein n=1 Tax=Amycolatopsis lurida NRRL 2430 TaxID=1460371 RepID=A0A2P2FYZ5_AMYLU|nr:trypco2 family protein [Amycolatopsis lurida]KFU81947.1 hypothetical protein BB31_06290 [Amycolatopsis lurida NRRL 2430]SEC38993.1 hypothetical protein SAMN04489729_1454 [Amycolatopsis lurida]
MNESGADGQLLMDRDGVPLSTAIALLRSELAEAIDAGREAGVRFVAESIELELEMVIKDVRKVDGKLSLWRVLSAGGSKQYESGAKHRLKLVLKPRDTVLSPDEETLIGDD